MTRGFYKDLITNRESGKQYSGSWCNNRIVNSSDVLIATLMKGVDGMQGILYLAIGAGAEEWDDENPTAPASVSRLHNEILRRPIAPEQIMFVDAMNQPSLSPTNRLEMRVDFLGAEIVTGNYLSLREFGLFGGNATEVTDSGQLINYVVHPRIDLTTNATLTRQLRLVFNGAMQLSGGAALSLPGVAHWIKDASIEIIDGVGKSFITRLASAGIETIGELAGMEPSSAQVNVPAMKLLELHSKARFAIQALSELAAISNLHGRPLKDLMITPTSQLASETSASHQVVKQFYEQLGFLQMVLDDKFLKDKTVTQLITGQGI